MRQLSFVGISDQPMGWDVHDFQGQKKGLMMGHDLLKQPYLGLNIHLPASLM
jgi:hypothetical protein